MNCGVGRRGLAGVCGAVAGAAEDGDTVCRGAAGRAGGGAREQPGLRADPASPSAPSDAAAPPAVAQGNFHRSFL